MAIGRLLAASFVAVLGLAILPARAGWREDLGTFRIGMVAAPGSGPVIEGAAAVRNAYATALAMPVEIFVARDYGALIDAQASSRIEYAIHSSSSYAAAFRMCGCVEPLVAPVSEDGSQGIRSVLIARAGGPGSTADLSTARIAFGPRDSTASYRLPLAELAPRGDPLTGAEPFLVG
ncbi:MAG: PhnD/SsuA/transferrin family substrate-binding protein, partial [Mesorhizobium sp.]|nr:PhnD/SsuA/transferrin family substrate-binding protein [Mesorhizobium sp.]